MYCKSNNLFEKILNSEAIHCFEDYLRAKLLSSDRINRTETIILARILWGRLTNSTKCLSGKLDSRHSKAQVITLLCISYYISQELFYFKRVISTDLYKLYIFHINKIDEYIMINSDIFLNEKNKRYHRFCIKSRELCDDLLGINVTSNFLSEKKDELLIIINNPKIDKINIDRKSFNFIQKLKIDDFIDD